MSLQTPPCPVFGLCGGCSYQHLSYEEELRLKEEELKGKFIAELKLPPTIFGALVASPKHYNYRHRLDIALRKLKTGEKLFGFVSPTTHHTIPIDSCPIAMEAVSDYLPTLKKEAFEKLPQSYRVANLTIKTGDDGKVYWGGIGKKSLQLTENKYFHTVVDGKKIYYSLDTFFQANLSILPLLRQTMMDVALWDKNTLLLDLYGGVGLFSVFFAECVKKVFLVEENVASIRMAEFNKATNQINSMEILSGKVEAKLEEIREQHPTDDLFALVDPPRYGLSDDAKNLLHKQANIKELLYLSCGPDSLLRDLKFFTAKGWNIKKIVPLDFFPRTKHLEVLTKLVREVIS